MKHSALIQHLDSLLPDLRRADHPEDVLLKHAHENNFAPGQLEKMAQLFNTMRTLSAMEKEGSRGATFDTLDVPALVDRYTEPKTATAVVKKAAAAPAHNVMRFPGFNRPIVKEASAPVVVESAHARSRREQIEDRDCETLEQIVDDYREKVSETFGKLASRIRDGVPFAKFEQDAREVLGEDVVETLDHLSAYLDAKGVKHARMTTPERRGVAYDRYEILPVFREAHDAYGTAGMAAEMVKDSAATKRRHMGDRPKGFGSPPPEEKEPKSQQEPRSSGGGGGSREEAPAGKGGGGGGSKFDFSKTLESYVQAPVAGVKGPLEAIKGTIEGFKGPNKRQMARDVASDDAVATSGLERLLHTDSILSKADPDTVVSLFNTIRQTNPHMAKDMNVMRFALREAVQYGSLPQHTAKDMLSMRESLAKAQDVENRNNAALYQ